jgi:RNA recognition motif-containing protein
VGGLSHEVSNEEFKSYFERFGAVTDAIVMMDRTTQRR